MSKLDPTDGRNRRGESPGAMSIPRHCTLEGFAEAVARREGVQISELRPLTRLHIKTHNSFYRVILLDPLASTAIVQGGRFFAEPSEVYLCGSSYGGTLLKMAWIVFGMRMEVLSKGRRIITSPVLSVETLHDAALPGPF